MYMYHWFTLLYNRNQHNIITLHILLHSNNKWYIERNYLWYLSSVISSKDIFLFGCFLKLIFIGVLLLCNAVLVSVVQQSESAIHIHISSLYWISFSVHHRASSEFSVLYSKFFHDTYLEHGISLHLLIPS